MRARVVESESQVPLAMADALKTGKLGVMDYMNLKNLDADTQMRSSIGKANDPAKPEKE
ncbi:SigmaW regulon antibacterial [compost metagenome]